MKKPDLVWRAAIGLAGGAAGLAVCLLGFGERLDLAVLDVFQRNLLPSPPSQVAIVEIDAAASEDLGWPLPRELFAAALHALKEAGAEGIGFDVFVSEGKGAGSDALEGGDNSAPKEGIFASAARSTDAVLASFVMTEEGGVPAPSSSPPRSIVTCPQKKPRSHLKQLLPDAPVEGLRVGHVHVDPSVDGAFRTLIPCVPVHDGCIADFSSMVAKKAPDASRCAHPEVVPFLRAYRDFRRMSFGELVMHAGGGEGAGRLRAFAGGRFVLVGPTDPTLGDFGPTPWARSEPLITVHANRVDALLAGVKISPIENWTLAVASLLALGGFLAAAGKARTLFAGAGLVAPAAFAAEALVFRTGQIFAAPVPAVLPFFAGAVSAGSFALWRYISFNKMLNQAFDSYVSPEVLEWLKKTGGTALKSDHAESREITILFSDIAGYTTLSNRLNTQEINKSLRFYLDNMVAIALKRKGYVDKINGDGLMILFGAPKASDRHADDAIVCALDMQQTIEEINPKWKELTGGADLNVRIGVATGHVFIGNLGGKGHVEYTAVGAAVNLAARLEKECQRNGILMSEETYKVVTLKPAGEWREVDLKGYEKQGPVKAWQTKSVIRNP
ncbi:MAG: adenylate/guanylate cyclase domain-containing protein [Deltaproteobacteria bacterium]|nr:adenylate/guanylate cyclase domain-containing protein [Deltaproteobacteria bacterium]